MMAQKGRGPRGQLIPFKFLVLFFVCFVGVGCEEEVSSCSFKVQHRQIQISSGSITTLEGNYAWDLCEALSVLPIDDNWKGVQMKANKQNQKVGLGDLWAGNNQNQNQNQNQKKIDLGCEGSVCQITPSGKSVIWGVSALTPVIDENEEIGIEVVGGSSLNCEVGERTTQFSLQCFPNFAPPLLSHPHPCSMEIQLFSPDFCLLASPLEKEEEDFEKTPFYGANCKGSVEGEDGSTYKWSLCSKMERRGECNGANFCQISQIGEEFSLGVLASGEPEQLDNALMLSLAGGSQGRGCDGQFRLSTILIYCKTKDKLVVPPPVVTADHCVYTLEIFSDVGCVEDEEELKRSEEEEKLSDLETKALLKEARKAFGRKKTSSSHSSGILLPIAQTRTGPEEMWKRMQLRRVQAKEKEREEEERREEERKQRKMAGGGGEMGWIWGLMEEAVEEQVLLGVSQDTPSSFTLDLFQRLEEEKSGGRAGKSEIIPPSFSRPVLSLPPLGGGIGERSRCSRSIMDDFLEGLANIGKIDESEVTEIEIEVEEGGASNFFVGERGGGSHLVRDRFRRPGQKNGDRGGELSRAEIANRGLQQPIQAAVQGVREVQEERGAESIVGVDNGKKDKKEGQENGNQNERNENRGRLNRGNREGGPSGRRRFDLRARAVLKKERRSDRQPLRNSALRNSRK